jgi:hypothetical protein
MDTTLGIENEYEGIDHDHRAYDTVTDRIWDRINKGVGFYVAYGLIDVD